jgi:hypothetical protein
MQLLQLFEREKKKAAQYNFSLTNSPVKPWLRAKHYWTLGTDFTIGSKERFFTGTFKVFLTQDTKRSLYNRIDRRTQ